MIHHSLQQFFTHSCFSLKPNYFMFCVCRVCRQYRVACFVYPLIFPWLILLFHPVIHLLFPWVSFLLSQRTQRDTKRKGSKKEDEERGVLVYCNQYVHCTCRGTSAKNTPWALTQHWATCFWHTHVHTTITLWIKTDQWQSLCVNIDGQLASV